MDEKQLVELGRRIEEAFRAADWEAYAAPMTDETQYESPRFSARGPKDIMPFIKSVKEAYPDMGVTATNVLACGNTLVRELTWEGTHTGPLKTPQGTIPPTNRRITFKGVVVLEASDDGEVVAIREYYDRVPVMAQLGIGAPAPPPSQ